MLPRFSGWRSAGEGDPGGDLDAPGYTGCPNLRGAGGLRGVRGAILLMAMEGDGKNSNLIL